MIESKVLAQIIFHQLVNWFGKPVWSNPLPPLDELVSTILSQNTNDVNRDRAFNLLRQRFKTWEDVRDAPLEEVVNTIRTAGLANQKGIRIQNILQAITAEHGSLELDFLREMPEEVIRAWLSKFKGVGPKTTAIVMQFSLGIPAFPVDTHIYRVSGRLGLRPVAMSVEQAHPHLAALFEPEDYYSAHLLLIRLGREICHARKPECTQCPLRGACKYFQSLTNVQTN